MIDSPGDEKLVDRLVAVRDHARHVLHEPDASPYLPVLIEYLDEIEEILRQGPSHPRNPREERRKLQGGFGRIATEDILFPESPLGQEMAEFVNAFVDGAG